MFSQIGGITRWQEFFHNWVNQSLKIEVFMDFHATTGHNRFTDPWSIWGITDSEALSAMFLLRLRFFQHRSAQLRSRWFRQRLREVVVTLGVLVVFFLASRRWKQAGGCRTVGFVWGFTKNVVFHPGWEYKATLGIWFKANADIMIGKCFTWSWLYIDLSCMFRVTWFIESRWFPFASKGGGPNIKVPMEEVTLGTKFKRHVQTLCFYGISHRIHVWYICGWFLWQMKVNMPYMDPMAMVLPSPSFQWGTRFWPCF